MPDSTPSSYYVRGLTLGFLGRYDEGSKDFAYYLRQDSSRWPPYEDYSWLLLKADRPAEALTVLQDGIAKFPNNPWLLNSRASALYELGRLGDARTSAQAAMTAAHSVTTEDWMKVNPGNDPNMAPVGIQKLRDVIEHNITLIASAEASSTSTVLHP